MGKRILSHDSPQINQEASERVKKEAGKIHRAYLAAQETQHPLLAWVSDTLSLGIVKSERTHLYRRAEEISRAYGQLYADRCINADEEVKVRAFDIHFNLMICKICAVDDINCLRAARRRDRKSVAQILQSNNSSFFL